MHIIRQKEICLPILKPSNYFNTETGYNDETFQPSKNESYLDMNQSGNFTTDPLYMNI